VLSGRGLCDQLITRPEESYRLCCVVVCDLETSRMGAPYVYDISRLRVKQGAGREWEGKKERSLPPSLTLYRQDNDKPEKIISVLELCNFSV